MISQHWFRWWLGAVRQQAIIWANVDPDLCRHMASLGHNELIPHMLIFFRKHKYMFAFDIIFKREILQVVEILFNQTGEIPFTAVVLRTIRLRNHPGQAPLSLYTCVRSMCHPFIHFSGSFHPVKRTWYKRGIDSLIFHLSSQARQEHPHSTQSIWLMMMPGARASADPVYLVWSNEKGH